VGERLDAVCGDGDEIRRADSKAGDHVLVERPGAKHKSHGDGMERTGTLYYSGFRVDGAMD
jgi:hypothetical protein